MKRTLLLLALIAPTLFAQSSSTPAARPNVLFIAVDDLRPELGCYGKDYMKTPNIDAIAKQGMVFDHAYWQTALYTHPISRIATGISPDT